MAIIRSINDQNWVIGMEWLTYDNPVGNDFLRAESLDMESPWYALRTNESVYQCGFCDAIDDIVRPKKLASLAAMLADVRPQPWLGIFELADDLYWYIAIRDHYAIQLGGDVIGTHDQVAAAAEQHSGFGGWTRVTGTMESLAALVSEAEHKKTKRTSVRSFAVSRIDPVPLAVTAGIIGILGAGVLIGYHFHAQNILEAQRLQFMADAAKRAASERVPDVHEVLLSTAEPSTWVQDCGSSMATVAYSDHGWTIAETDCNASTVRIIWERGPGATIANVPPGAVVASDGNSATQSLLMRQSPVRGRDNSADVTTETRSMQTWGQAHNVTVKIGAPQPISMKEKEGWMIPVTIPMPISPFLPGSGLDDIPGLRISPANQTKGGNAGAAGNAGSAWSLSGVLYARQ